MSQMLTTILAVASLFDAPRGMLVMRRLENRANARGFMPMAYLVAGLSRDAVYSLRVVELLFTSCVEDGELEQAEYEAWRLSVGSALS